MEFTFTEEQELLRRSVRAFVDDAVDLVHVLMRHLVLQHFDHRAPRFLEDELSRDLDRAARRHPTPEPRRDVRELERRGLQAIAEVRRVDRAVRTRELAHERGFELGAWIVVSRLHRSRESTYRSKAYQ